MCFRCIAIADSEVLVAVGCLARKRNNVIAQGRESLAAVANVREGLFSN